MFILQYVRFMQETTFLYFAFLSNLEHSNNNAIANTIYYKLASALFIDFYHLVFYPKNSETFFRFLLNNVLPDFSYTRPLQIFYQTPPQTFFQNFS